MMIMIIVTAVHCLYILDTVDSILHLILLAMVESTIHIL